MITEYRNRFIFNLECVRSVSIEHNLPTHPNCNTVSTEICNNYWSIVIVGIDHLNTSRSASCTNRHRFVNKLFEIIFYRYSIKN